ncbi:MAG TPA: hypothetical protein VJ742_05500 [Nitrososphaera sp.]|nr:hypothetical protein [Nitrososphaera sp.]
MDRQARANNGDQLTQEYRQFLDKAATLFPKVDQKLLLDILRFQTAYHDWEGNALIKLVYPAGVDLEKKKEWIFSRYDRVPSIEENKTVRFKAFKMYVQELANLVAEDPEIEYVTGSTSLTPAEAYSA